MRSLLVSAEDRTQRVADLAERGVSAHRVENPRHGVFRTLRRPLKSIERLPDPDVVAPRAQGVQFLLLMPRAGKAVR